VALKEQIQRSSDSQCAKDDEECELHDTVKSFFRSRVEADSSIKRRLRIL
jgi:hypothetical protein